MSTGEDRGKFSFASGSNANYIVSMYEQYSRDPQSVDESWRRFFEGYEFAAEGATIGKKGADSEEAKVESLINAFRRLGHKGAYLNPLDEPNRDLIDDLKPEYHGLSDVDPNRIFHPSNLGIEKDTPTFNEIVDFLNTTYCGKIGADYRDINDIESVVWLQEQMEACRNQPVITKDEKLRIFDKLVQAEGFERFLQDRYLGQKRFSIEGLDAMIPLLDVIAEDANKAGVEEINLAMAHRGRLNVLANFMGKEYDELLHEFEGAEFNPLNIEGDVKYHKGFANEVDTSIGGKIRLYLSPNPSHLEAVNPVLEGFTRARQRLLNDQERTKVMPVLIHGDAAFVGQGVVAETLNLANLPSYCTGGTIHVIANNQLGFTAYPEETKSCDYASDIAKFLRAPVLHVNADDPEATVWAARLAVAYRQKFQRDFVIDLVGYRRHGHNETDEPSFTQPLMYKKIKDHPTVLSIYQKKLIEEGALSEDEAKSRLREFRAMLQERLQHVRSGAFTKVSKVPEALKYSLKYVHADREDIEKPLDTRVKRDVVMKIQSRILEFPKGFHPHAKIEKLFESRRKMFEGEGEIDWGMAELLAFGSAALDGYHVRLSGQDCGRGTFSHRHAILRDFNTNKPLNILNQIGDNQATVDVINSPLSEAGCLGFEFGYSVADPDSLVLWEAQFGDFANGAQIIIDQFLVASEAKWKQASSLVLLLPHGYEGQGPEHSSARPERFLQSCGNLNIQVANLTTPAQLFHILRRQVMREFQKPLVIMTPKSLLRHPKVVSSLKAFTEGGFTEIIDDPSINNPDAVKRLVVCTGKVYYDLEKAREENDQTSEVPLIRIEQLYPFPKQKLAEVLKRYSGVREIYWTQEEPVNMGAWTFMRPRLEKLCGPNQVVKYVGRKGSGSTAEGSLKSHIIEQQRIVQDALGLARTLDPKAKKNAKAASK